MKLPSSNEEVTSVVMVSMIAGMAMLARILYGREELRWRYTLGGVLVAMVTAVMVYGGLIQYVGPLGGHASAAVGAAVGLFTDDILRRSREWMLEKTKQRSNG